MVAGFPPTQHALVYEQYNGPLEIKQLPIPEPKDDELLIKILYSGICHSDLHGWQGDWAELCTLPTIGGHEGAGEVVKIGSSVTDWKVGDKAGVKVIFLLFELAATGLIKKSKVLSVTSKQYKQNK